MASLFSRGVNRLRPRRGAARARSPPPPPPPSAPSAASAHDEADAGSDSDDSESSGRGYYVSHSSGYHRAWVFGSDAGDLHASESADDCLGEYRVTGRLGSGGFGSVWLAKHLRGQAGVAPGAQVALKFDTEPCEGQADPALLPSSPDGRVPLSSADLVRSSVLREAHAYCALLGGCGPAPPDAPLPSFAVPFICEVRIAHELADPLPGECTKAYEGRFVYALALPKLGRSLYAVGRYDAVKPTAAQALKLGAKMISAVQYVHERGLLHLDIKPENFCLANDRVPLDDAKVVLIDFGLALEASHEIKEHINRSLVDGLDYTGCEDYFVGSPSYASRRMLKCEPASYRDDLESVFYVLTELVMGEQLPWSCKDKKSASDSDDCDESAQFTASFKRRHVAHSNYDMSALLRRLPPVLQTMWGMIQALQFGEVPDYDAFRATLLPAAPAVRSKRGTTWPAAGAPAGLASAPPKTGPEEPNGKRLRAAIAASMQHEE